MAQNDMFGGLGMIALGVTALLALFWLYRSYMDRDTAAGANTAGAANSKPYQAPAVAPAAEPEPQAPAAEPADAYDVQPAPMGFAPYGASDDSAYFADYPQSQDASSLDGDGRPSSYDMNLSALMPASWRGAGGCASVDAGGEPDEWGKYAPSKAAFENYITAAGSARLGMNTRVRNPTGGVANLLRPAPPVPMSAADVTFNDSSFRQDLVYDSLGAYPTQVQC
jgi:hypothetical protein